MDSEACLTRAGTCFLRSKSEAVISPRGKSLSCMTWSAGKSRGFEPMQRVSEVLYEEVPGRVQEPLAGGEDDLGLRATGKGL